MRRKASIVSAALVVVLLLGACSKIERPTPDQIAAGDYGSVPHDFQERIKAFMKPHYFDPYTVVYEFKEPVKGFYFFGTKVAAFGYFVDVGINAKNRFGGYAGVVPFRFFVRNEEPVRSCQIYKDLTFCDATE